MKLADFMTSPVITIAPTASLFTARSLMRQHAISHLPALQGGQIMGLLTRRRLQGAESRVLRQSELHQLRVSDVMTPHVAFTTPEASAVEAAKMLWDGQAACLLIMQGRRLVGVATVSDLLDVLIAHLEQGISARYDHFLVPTDFGAAAKQALRAAEWLAQRHEARLTLLHVIPKLTHLIATDIDHASADIAATLYEASRVESHSQLDALAAASTRPVACQVVEGNPADAIVRASIRLKVDLIIMGRRPNSWRSYFKRSVSQRVMRRSPCPVITASTPNPSLAF